MKKIIFSLVIIDDSTSSNIERVKHGVVYFEKGNPLIVPLNISVFKDIK